LAITTISSREFNQNRSSVKRAADRGPVIVTDRGKPCLVVLKFEDYQKMSEKRGSILERLHMPDVAEIDIDFEPPRMNLELRIPEFDTETCTDGANSNQTFEPAQPQDAPAIR
jgi:prevent-host-death family protein